MRITYSEQASNDLESIFLYGLERFGALQAEKYLNQIQKTASLISKYPSMGRIDYRLSPPTNSFRHKSHIIFYDIFSAEIIILRIIHSSADPQKHLLPRYSLD